MISQPFRLVYFADFWQIFSFYLYFDALYRSVVYLFPPSLPIIFMILCTITIFTEGGKFKNRRAPHNCDLKTRDPIAIFLYVYQAPTNFDVYCGPLRYELTDILDNLFIGEENNFDSIFWLCSLSQTERQRTMKMIVTPGKDFATKRLKINLQDFRLDIIVIIRSSLWFPQV